MEGSGIRDSFYFSRISYNALNHDVELRLVNRTIAAEVCRNKLKLKKKWRDRSCSNVISRSFNPYCQDRYKDRLARYRFTTDLNLN